ncbi:hypothetical protein GCM10009646_43570 [Streptomyces aureus]
MAWLILVAAWASVAELNTPKPGAKRAPSTSARALTTERILMGRKSFLLVTVLAVRRLCRWSKEIVPEFYARPPERVGWRRGVIEATPGVGC